MKFGGASVRDAANIRNVAQIIAAVREPQTVAVVSAMDKTTNALEKLAHYATQGKDAEAGYQLQKIADFHLHILHGLFDQAPAEAAEAEAELRVYLAELERITRGILLLGDFPDRVYDRIMAYGELMSTVVVAHYLRAAGLPAVWVDARQIIRTDATFKDARVIWNATQAAVDATLRPLVQAGKLVVIQGYIASTPDGRTTTLGREGSDYTASIMAHCLDADRVTIWKDVPGVMSADPKRDPSAVLLPRLSYQQAIEMTFYGASVIHPKTIQPLYQKGIPLYVKSFNQYQAQGTVIDRTNGERLPQISLHKGCQALLRLTPRDLAFMDDERMRALLNETVAAGLQINLVQNSAVSLTLCVNDDAEAVRAFAGRVSDRFDLSQQTDVALRSLLYCHPDAQAPDGALVVQRDERNLHYVVAEG